MSLLKILLFGMPGMTEIILLIVVIVFFFGGKKIPDLMRGIGKGISEFKKGKAGIEDPEERKE
jgi:sec-independent protein translocase protein TatA